MHFGHRIQNVAADKIFNKRARPPGAFDADRDPAATAPISAARLAAEAAFDAPSLQPTPASQAHITVRRARLGVLAEQPAVDAVALAELTVKGPRVFRVEPAFAVASAAAALPPPQQQAVPPRKRPATPDKQPGKVVHVVHLQARPREASPPPVLRLDALVAALARVGPVLESIQRAQSFHFIDDRYQPAWQRLSKQADELLHDIRAGGR